MAKKYFVNVFQQKLVPIHMPKMKLANKNIIGTLILSRLAKSKSEARRLIGQKGIKIGGRVVESTDETIKSGSVIQKGKRHFVKII
mgnify:CR=1 FL=1